MSRDNDFNDEQKQFGDAILKDPEGYGLTKADAASFTTSQAAWAAALPAHRQARTDAETATQKKELAKKDLGEKISGLTKKIRGTAGMTADKLVAAGIAPIAATRSPAGVPETRPLGRSENKPNHTIVIHFVDEETPTKAAKPANVHGCEVWSAVGATPPDGPSGYAFLALDTRTPYTDVHPKADVGKNAYYLLRWQNHKGESGPWSEVLTVKIPD